MRLAKIWVGVAVLAFSPFARAADKVSFSIPANNTCRVKYRKTHDSQSKFADFREKLPEGTTARGLSKKGLVMFKVQEARFKDFIFLGKASCFMSGSGGSSETAESIPTKHERTHSGLYAKALPLYFSEPLTFAGTNNVTEALTAKNIGAALGLGYDFGGSFFVPSLEVLPLFATSTIKNKGTAKASIYDGKGLVLGAAINIIGHFKIGQMFAVGPYLPLLMRIESFPTKDLGKISDSSSKFIYGGGVSLRLDLGAVRTGLQIASLGFKSDFLAGLSLELKL